MHYITPKNMGSTLLLLLLVAGAHAQHERDSLPLFNEFLQVGIGYWQLPLQMDIQLHSKTIPWTAANDSSSTAMKIYYSNTDFYILAEGMEQIANDSLVLMVNKEAKIIKLYPNRTQLQNSMERTVKMFVSDSSVHSLINKYTASSEQAGDGIRQITLQTREKTGNTSLPKEKISLRFDIQTHQPLSLTHSKFILALTDSASYQQMTTDKMFEGRLLTSKKSNKGLFFLIKEQQLVCYFTHINHQSGALPVRQEDRVVRLEDGRFVPVKEYADYVVSKEF